MPTGYLDKLPLPFLEISQRMWLKNLTGHRGKENLTQEIIHNVTGYYIIDKDIATSDYQHSSSEVYYKGYFVCVFILLLCVDYFFGKFEFFSKTRDKLIQI